MKTFFSLEKLMADLTRAHAVLLTIQDLLDTTRLPASQAFAAEETLEALEEIDRLLVDYFLAPAVPRLRDQLFPSSPPEEPGP